MKIVEIYPSLQGEGLLAGTPSVFVRASGCNLRCHWCDTPFTSWDPQGEEMSAAEIVATVHGFGHRHAVLTGGEPLLFADTLTVAEALRRAGLHVTIETAGTVAPAAAEQSSIADLVSISPKLSSSAPPADTAAGWAARHEAARRRDDVLARLMARGQWQLKFVVGSPADLDEAVGWLADLGITPGPAAPVFFMPEGVAAASLAQTTSWLEQACRRHGVRIAPRHHIAWFGNTRRT